MASDSEDSDLNLSSLHSSLSGRSLLKPKLDTIFSEVTKNLPDISFDDDGSDISSEDDEAEVQIFQRQVACASVNIDHKTLVQDIDKDLDESNEIVNDDDIASFIADHQKKTSVSAGTNADIGVRKVKANTTVSVGTNWHDLQPPQPKVNNWVANNDSTSETKCEINRQDSDEGIIPDVGDHCRVSSDQRKPNKLKTSYSAEDSKQLVSMYLPSNAPTLSFNNISQFDIDEVLESVDSSGTTVTESIYDIGDMLNSSSAVTAGADDGAGEQRSIIERLASLSASHLGEEINDIDPRTGAISKRKPQTKEEKTARNSSKVTAEGQKPKTSSSGTNTNDLANYAKIAHTSLMPHSSLSASNIKTSDTIFIDLRNFDLIKEEQQRKIEAVQRVLGIEQTNKAESSDDDDDDDRNDHELWHEQRRRIKQTLASKGVLPDVLPSKPSPPTFQQPKNRKQEPQRTETKVAVEQSAPAAQNTATSEITKPDVADRKLALAAEEKRKKFEKARRLKEQKDHEQKSRIRLGKRLEALKPITSINGRQPMAEATPTMYHEEASYEPELDNLPSNLREDKECCLITVLLSSNGEIVTHRGHVNKSVDSGQGLSASYTTLLTWLLSLVPNDFTFLQEEPKPRSTHAAAAAADTSCTAPFHVIGLQQMWADEQLKLVVAVTANAAMKPPSKSRRKTREEGSTPFQQQLIKYLAMNTLHTVCPWLANLVSLDVTNQDGDHSYVYRPPLPNITTNPLSTFMQIVSNVDAARRIFAAPVAFFWQTIETDELYPDLDVDETKLDHDMQNTMSLIYKNIYVEPTAMMGIFNRVLQDGLDVAGVRLVYPSTAYITANSGSVPSQLGRQSRLETLNNIGPVLAIVIRGTSARTIWLDTIGPADPVLARKTDPNSVCALYGGETRDKVLIFCPRTATRIFVELVSWFSGRVPSNGVIDVGKLPAATARKRSGSPKSSGKNKKGSSSETEQDELLISPTKPAVLLTATTLSDIVLVLSPLLPIRCFGLILTVCQRRGYSVRGIKRMKLTTKKATSLGLIGQQTVMFNPTSSLSPTDDKMFDFSDNSIPEIHQPCTLLLLRKENAVHTSASLIEAFMVQMSILGLLGPIQHSIDVKLTSRLLFHSVGFTETLLNNLGGDFSKMPDNEIQPSPSYIAPKMYTNPELEEIVVIALTGHQMMKSMGIFVAKLLNLLPYANKSPPSYVREGFELLGMKWLSGLTPNQARELTPYEVGDKNWKSSIHTLTSEPAMILVVRGENAFQRVENIIVPKSIYQVTDSNLPLDKMMSATPELAYRYATMFFHERELWSDPSSRPLLPYLPPSRFTASESDKKHLTKKKTRGSQAMKSNSQTAIEDEHIFQAMLAGAQPLCTMLVVKPDAMKHLTKILRRVDSEGFEIVAMNMLVFTRSQAAYAIPKEAEEDDVELKKHVEHLTAAPSMVMVLKRENAVKRLVDLLGPTDPQGARRLSQFYWRGVFGTTSIYNGLHGSVTYTKAVEGIKTFFPEGVCCQSTLNLHADEIPCPAIDPDISIDQYRRRRLEMKSPEDGLISSAMSSPGLLHVSSLTQTTCIVLPPRIINGSGQTTKHSYVEIIDGLLSHGFELVGSKMVNLTQQQSEDLCHIVEAGNFHQVPMLTSGPSLVLVLQRDNAVRGFQTLTMSVIIRGESLNKRYGAELLRPRDQKQSNNMILYFFNNLPTEGQVEIRSASTSDTG
ncbi:dynein axonemal assembly factor 8-like [Tubulanus polymorphus]|uniref:dynein axonemal assembly factor 8-like n=1 Tax=Tubulanus polymorphus TaxID=672921 RepID=UPI003DA4F61A